MALFGVINGMKKLAVMILSILITGCAGILEKQEPVCYGISIIGGQETSIPIYGKRTQANQTQYKAGGPYSWHWVNKSNFTSTTCDQ